MNKIRKGDTVMMVAGKDKGRTGTVLKVLQKKNKHKTQGPWVVVEGLNIVKKHKRGNPQMEQPGGIIPKEAPVHISNVAYCGLEGKPTRIGFKHLEDGTKVRVMKRSGEVCDA